MVRAPECQIGALAEKIAKYAQHARNDIVDRSHIRGVLWLINQSCWLTFEREHRDTSPLLSFTVGFNYEAYPLESLDAMVKRVRPAADETRNFRYRQRARRGWLRVARETRS